MTLHIFVEFGDKLFGIRDRCSAPAHHLIGIVEISLFARNLITDAFLIDLQKRIYGCLLLDYSQLGFAGITVLVA